MPRQWRLWNDRESLPRIILRGPVQPKHRCYTGKVTWRTRDSAHQKNPATSHFLDLPSRRQWFINDIHTVDGKTHYRICIWIKEEELSSIAHLGGDCIETKRIGTRFQHRMQLWLPEQQLPDTKTNLFKTRNERLRSLRSFRG
jgi:hypothetical protein